MENEQIMVLSGANIKADKDAKVRISLTFQVSLNLAAGNEIMRRALPLLKKSVSLTFEEIQGELISEGKKNA